MAGDRRVGVLPAQSIGAQRPGAATPSAAPSASAGPAHWARSASARRSHARRKRWRAPWSAGAFRVTRAARSTEPSGETAEGNSRPRDAVVGRPGARPAESEQQFAFVHVKAVLVGPGGVAQEQRHRHAREVLGAGVVPLHRIQGSRKEPDPLFERTAPRVGAGKLAVLLARVVVDQQGNAAPVTAVHGEHAAECHAEHAVGGDILSQQVQGETGQHVTPPPTHAALLRRLQRGRVISRLGKVADTLPAHPPVVGSAAGHGVKECIEPVPMLDDRGRLLWRRWCALVVPVAEPAHLLVAVGRPGGSGSRKIVAAKVFEVRLRAASSVQGTCTAAVRSGGRAGGGAANDLGLRGDREDRKSEGEGKSPVTCH